MSCFDLTNQDFITMISDMSNVRILSFNVLGMLDLEAIVTLSDRRRHLEQLLIFSEFDMASWPSVETIAFPKLKTFFFRIIHGNYPILE